MNANAKATKLVLVAVLGVAFLATAGNAVYSIVAPPSAVPVALEANVPVRPAGAVEVNETAPRSWPVLELEQIIEHDPFALPASEPSAAEAGAVAAPAGGAAQTAGGVQPGVAQDGASAAAEVPFSGRIMAVYQRGNQRAAIIDSRTVQPGDSLEGTGRVLQVDQGGVTLSVEN